MSATTYDASYGKTPVAYPSTINISQSGIDAKRVLELSLERLLHLTGPEAPTSFSPDLPKIHQQVIQYGLALSSCRTLGNDLLLQNLLTFQPLVVAGTIDAYMRDGLRLDLQFFLAQISSMSMEQLDRS